MNKNLQELTEKIYQEGVEKARKDGDELLRQAKAKAQEIVAQAEAKAKQLVEKAENQAAEVKQINEAEMRLAMRQSIASLKQKIVDLIITDMVSLPLQNAFKDEEFLKSLIEKMVNNWSKSGIQGETLEVLLPKKDAARLKDFFVSRGNEFLKKGVVVKFSDKMTDGFQIQPEGGRFKISFTSEDFESYFKTFVRPRSFDILFGTEK